MKILVIGSKQDFNNLREKLSDKYDFTFVEDAGGAFQYLEEQDVIFDFILDEFPDNLDVYKDIEGLTVFVNIPKLSLAELYYYNDDIACDLFGFNGIPGFFEKPKLEVSIPSEDKKQKLEEISSELEVEFNIVQDRVGMVAPRVVCMIINEAFYTVTEGTATREDIDLGMKLGTNYPEGPFHWLKTISVRHVYELLEAMYDDTKDERYKIAPMLKKEYMTAMR